MKPYQGQTAEKIEGILQGLVQQLKMLAPHPDQPLHRGPLFVTFNPATDNGSEYKHLLSNIFSLASGLERLTGAYLSCPPAIPAAANNNYQIGQKNVVCIAFNQGATRDVMMQAFYGDLPRRLGLERLIAYYQRMLYAVKKNACARSFRFAA